MNQTSSGERNFETISPSAKWLLLMKGYTNIPFVRQAAELLLYPDHYIPDFNKKDLTFWARTLHFETRYYSINQLLNGFKGKNILELSSGYSFRGLDLIRHREIHFIDTDLSEVITQKAKLISIIGKDLDTIGDLELLQLNVLDKKQFTEIISHFPAGEIIIVNEGLLMYLNRAEKEILSGIIYNILKERQGYWIVADIYVKNRKQRHHLKIGSKLKEYYAQQNIEDNKFESFEDAEQFFNNMGFVIDRVARIKPWTLSSWRYLLRSLTFRQFLQFFKIKKMRATWRLRLSNN